ncbi:sentrin-specific protease 6-like isoform X2 [Osmerus mordax]|uniref:sentrin-specific protease 6-like isoform X2 n=1 Tax=Osmerus mordax TaxID=8014 RepID=UPI00350EF932
MRSSIHHNQWREHGINMAHNRSFFIDALDRSEARRDGGYTQNWSFSLSDDSEEERRHDTSAVTMEESNSRQQQAPPEGKKSPTLRHFSADPLRTYENRPNSHSRTYNKRLNEAPLAVATPSPMPNRTNYLIVSPSPSQGVVLQGRHFQHANAHSPMRKPVQSFSPPQSSLDLKERNDFSTAGPQIQSVEVDSIILTCPEVPEDESLNIKRRLLLKRKPSDPKETCCSLQSPAKPVEPLCPSEYFTVCGKCGKRSEDHAKCQSCGHALSPESPCHAHLLPVQLASPAPRPPVRPQPQPSSPGPHSFQSGKSFYGAASTMRAPRMDVVPVRITRGNMLQPLNGRPSGLAATTSCCGARVSSKGKRSAAARQLELNDPIVLSSDDDEEEADNASTGSVNRLDSVSPRPADSAHSSPAPSGGKVEAAVKSSAEQEEITSDFFADIDTKISIPRRPCMKDQCGNHVPDDTTPRKKPKMALDSIILECRSVRVGTLRRMVTKPVIFSVDHIHLETEGPEVDALEKVSLRGSELTSCEWCSVRKLPVLFFQTTQEECLRLRTQLNMSREDGGLWYDCSGDQSDEKYIVLIFENGLLMHEQMILEDILVEIGRANNLTEFPTKLSFDEANIRLGKPAGKPPAPAPVRTRMATRQHASMFFGDEEDDMAELQPTFTGPIIKLMVYPPPPAKGGITVTNEDLHCLHDGEFLNDVIIDFYLKYLVLEKLKREEAQRSHVFSSFFYKRLNQRERRSLPDTTHLPIQKRKHNRVKTWTRHVDLFQKDFIFVPINESAHWYLAVICFPGLQGPQYEPNPMYQGPASAACSTQAPGPAPCPTPGPGLEDSFPDHCRPLSPERDDFLEPSDDPPANEALLEAHSNSNQPKGASASTEGGQEPPQTPGTRSNGQTEAQPQYTDGLHRISVTYGPGNGNNGSCAFSDDQSSCQDECSEDGGLADDSLNQESSGWTSRPTLCKQPCILIMDSLRGPARSTVVKTLREYLEVEWEARKGSQRSFGKDVMKGSSPRVPQQDNFSDCGVYILQYVESFFENPLPSFHLPVNLSEWFPQQRMKTKREEIKELIRKIQTQQELDKKEAAQGSATGSPQEQDRGREGGVDTGSEPSCQPLS